MSRIEMRWTGLLLLMMPMVIIVSWTGLMIRFEYPDILREPVEVILHKYREGGMTVKLYWTGMVVSSLLLIPIVMLLYRFTSHANRSLRLAAAGVGLSSAIFHIIGFSRWLFAVDELAAQYGKDSLTAGQKEAIEIIFNAFHTYLGVTVGETLGFVTMGVWAILSGVAFYQSGLVNKWAAFLSVGSGIGISAGVLEWTGFSFAAEINAYAYQIWILLIAYVGVTFLLVSSRYSKKARGRV